MSGLKLGVHISGVARLYEAFDKARALGCNTMQVFSRSPQRWRERALVSGDIERFRQAHAASGIEPVFIHVPYLINLASPNPRLYKASIQAYIEDIVEAQSLGVDYLVTHMGSHKETTEIGGIRRFARALNKIIAATNGSSVGILLENTAGSGSWLGYKFSHHRRIIEKLKDTQRVGVCLDTAHAFLAGYDLRVADGLERLLSEIEKNVGLTRLKLIHLNDAQGKLGSHHDRHDHIGQGAIGMEGMRMIINEAKFSGVPFILETPKDSETADAVNLKRVLTLIAPRA